MKKIKFLLALPLAAVIFSGCASVREVGTVNGVVLTDVRQRGLFTPCKTTLLGHKPEVPNEVEVLADASGPGLVPAVATAGGIAGGAALLRPSKTSVSNTSNNKADSQAGNSGEISAASVNDIPVTINSTPAPGKNTPPSPPPGHVNNPSQNN